MTTFKDYFYGNKISEYGRKNGRVDYRTLAKAFDAVLNNDIMTKTYDIGYWDQESGLVDNSDEIDELRDKIDDLEIEIADLEDGSDYDDKRAALEDKISDLEDKISELEDEQDDTPEIYQWYIVSDNGAEILKEYNEIVFYNSELDIYLWGVTHWGTSWDYVLTSIPCEKDETANA